VLEIVEGPEAGRLITLPGPIELGRDPAVGGALLGWQPLAVWPVAAAVCLFSAAGCLALERRLPDRVRRTPAPEPVTLAPLAQPLVAPGPGT